MVSTDTLFRRPARMPAPAVPEGEVVLQPPPELPKPDSGGVWLTALPALSGLGSVAYLFAGPPSPVTYVAGSFFLFSSLAIVAGSLLRSRSSQKGDAAKSRQDYLRYLATVRAQVRRTAAAQRENVEWNAPDPNSLWSVVDSPRLWERRRTDDDFGVLRVGTGPRYLATSLVPGESAPVEDLDPLAALALKKFVKTHTAVPDLPVQVSLNRFAGISVDGDRDAARAMVRALLAQAVTFHPPKDLRILVCTTNPNEPAWRWVKWLPHARHPEHNDHAGPLRQLHPALATLERMLGTELTRRSRFNRNAETDPDLSHLLVVLDEADVAGDELMLVADGLQSVTVVDLDGVAADLVGAHGLAMQVTEDGALAVRVGSRVDPLGRADSVVPDVIAALAQRLAGFRLDTSGPSTGDLSASSRTLPELLGLADVGAMNLDTLWRQRPIRDRLRTPIGVSADGTVLELDIKEAAQDGMGPHGLLVGATGSGKSELLRTLVLGMAASHPPDQLNLVLVDFKGGATFAKMGQLPHVAATITNLEDDLSLVDRMQQALSGEMNRRQEILRGAGNLVSVRDYEHRRMRGADLAPLPSLFIVVDEFSELLSQKPDFVDLFVQIGRLGRSLGLHLLLASQRLDEGRLRGLEAHLSYRIGLRTFSAEESRAAIGVPDAFQLPNSPGHGYLSTEASTLKRFRASYVSGTYAEERDEWTEVLANPLEVRPFPASYLPVPQGPVTGTDNGARSPDHDGDHDDDNSATLLSVMVDQMAGHGLPAHRVWLPPLDAPAPLDALIPGLGVRTDRGYGAPPELPELVVPVGIVDRPYHQRRDPMLLDLAGAGGHVAIVGGPRSGKSTLLRTLIAGLALRHTPAEVQFYALDFSGTLFSMTGLPHVGGVGGRQDAEIVQRVVAEVSAVVEQRESRFRELGVDGMAAYRRLRGNGDAIGDPFGDVFLIVDGWAVLRQDYEDVEEQVLRLASHALTYGVHIVVTANRWLDLRLGMRDLIGTKVELKLGDPLDSEMDRRVQETVPVDRPGRGVTRDRLHFLSAVPRVDAVAGAEDLGAGVDDLIARISDGWRGVPAPSVRLLPGLLEFEELPAAARREGLAIGVEGRRLRPVVLDPRVDAGLVLVGDSECGKTSTLRAVARQVTERAQPRRDKVVLIDYRLSMLSEFEGDTLLGYAATHQQATDLVAGLVEGFTKRLPGPDVTPEQLRERSWWTGPDVHIIVDDYDLVATSVGNPLLPLLEFVPQARTLGLHLYIAQAGGGAGRAVLDPVLVRLRELSFPTVVMSAPPDEGLLFGVRPRRLRRGRGTLVHRGLGTVPIQLARLDSVHDQGRA